jgi:hypothetical protein
VAKRAILRAVLEQPEQQRVGVVVEACRNLGPEVLGYVVFPALRDTLREDDGFFAAWMAHLGKQRLSLDLSGVLLDFLDDAARVGRVRRKRMWYGFLREVMGRAGISAKVKAKAMRLLVRDPGAETQRVMRRLFDEGRFTLVDAAGHVLATWLREGVAAARSLAPRLVRYARAHPTGALRSAGVLRAVRAMRTTQGRATLRRLARLAEKSPHRDRLLAAAGEKLEPAELARLMRRIQKKQAGESELVLRGLFASEPKSLQRLSDAGFEREFVYGLKLAPGAARVRMMKKRIRQMIGDREVAILPAMQHASGKYLPGAPIQKKGRSFQTSAPAPVSLRGGFVTGFQLGDALYRDLLTQFGNAEHWHTGLFLGFSATSDGTGTLQGLHAADGIGWSDTITTFSASRWFGSVNTDLAAEMPGLRHAFLKEFADGRADHPFHGARSVPGITSVERKQIVDTAATLLGKNIWWTWVDMLDYQWTGWDGTVEDIDELRCDGVVEYCYETHNLRVCGGKNPNVGNQWNIAVAGKNHPENHNDFHDHDYDPGELCPRIQAGDQGNDATFIRPVMTRPQVVRFSVTPFAQSFAPIVWFEVAAPQSRVVLARLLVRKHEQATFHFVRTDDPNGGMGTPVGDWRLMQANANAPGEAAFWIGKTAGGPDFSGHDGTFEFRLQVIDQGGNVSDEQSTEVTIDWP